MRIKLLGITRGDFIVINQRFVRKKWEFNGTVHQIFIDFKQAYDSVRRVVLYSILIEFGVPRKSVGLIKMCLNKTYGSVHIGGNR
jgi:hypothetical protein